MNNSTYLFIDLQNAYFGPWAAERERLDCRLKENSRNNAENKDCVSSIAGADLDVEATTDQMAETHLSDTEYHDAEHHLEASYE